jgi:hypothetical protein
MASIFGAYVRWAKRAPFVSQVIVATGKTIAADVLVQTVVENRTLHEINMQRVGIFAGFGFLYLGVVQYGLYVKGMQRLFNKEALDKFCNAPIRQKIRDVTGLKILAGTIAIDFFAIQPFLYWPTYYVVKEIGYTGGLDGTRECRSVEGSGAVAAKVGVSSTMVSSALTKYKNSFWEDNLGMCGFWLPMDMVIYSVPLHMRLHLNHTISFAWVALVSIFRGGNEYCEEVAAEKQLVEL